ncbi:hypothetical protein [Hyalangium minutum]|uniref:Uncharacterized protein n=1 Tax=Hyalangium minutum TaxID=394096 RepID=A0A085WWC1_9BACT|nr:hypothetical protein [Hyalangium minutum]KFE71984.1 hypothetical protein DB31_0245 [Hyalangium minutum]
MATQAAASKEPMRERTPRVDLGTIPSHYGESNYAAVDAVDIAMLAAFSSR